MERLALFVFRPARFGRRDVVTLALLGTAGEQDHELTDKSKTWMAGTIPGSSPGTAMTQREAARKRRRAEAYALPPYALSSSRVSSAASRISAPVGDWRTRKRPGQWRAR